MTAGTAEWADILGRALRGRLIVALRAYQAAQEQRPDADDARTTLAEAHAYGLRDLLPGGSEPAGWVPAPASAWAAELERWAGNNAQLDMICLSTEMMAHTLEMAAIKLVRG